MKHRFALALPLLLLATGAVTTRQEGATGQDSKRAKVERLLVLTGSAKMGEQVIQTMLQAFRNNPNVPAGFIDKFTELAKGEELVKLIVPIYEKHVAEADLDAVLAFFESPAGSRWLQAQPKVAQESQAAAQNWGRSIATKALHGLQKGK